MNDPFDRSDIGESSLAATERLRARLMTQGPAGSQQTSRRGGFAWAIAAALFAFAAGLIANPWFEQTVRGRLPFVAAASNGEADALEKRLAEEAEESEESGEADEPLTKPVIPLPVPRPAKL